MVVVVVVVMAVELVYLNDPKRYRPVLCAFWGLVGSTLPLRLVEGERPGKGQPLVPRLVIGCGAKDDRSFRGKWFKGAVSRGFGVISKAQKCFWIN